ncbi:MAG: class I SAM-dependent methyltransferase [Deltaproteobacteria bacterium]|nr:class I SAM-dependent methyltransferase [Deltaproteobacteria bacterium]
MGKLLNLVNPLHQSTKRDYIGRMVDDKAACMKTARLYDKEFWDGDRRFGYGGYKYDGRWSVVAKRLIDNYKLGDGFSCLDVGCGKGFLLHELKVLSQGARVAGFDISEYAISQAKEEVLSHLFVHSAETPLPYGDKEFDLAISLTTLHNLEIFKLKTALEEMERVARDKFLVVESYRNEPELFNLQCWALTAECFYRPEEWIWLFDHFGYTGDYEFIFFE